MSEENDKVKMAIESEQSTSKRVSTETLVAQREKQSTDAPELLDDTWAELSQDWQSQPYQKVDVQALLTQTKKRTFWAKFFLAINILATMTFIVVVIVLWMNNSQDKATITYLTFATIGSVIFVYYEIKIRLKAWKQISASPDLAIKNAIEGIESSINYIRLTKFSCWFLIPAGSWYVIEMAKQNDKSIWFGLIMMNVSVGVMWGITHLFHRKRKMELDNLTSSLSEQNTE